jgi:phosphonate dehydrogenase
MKPKGVLTHWVHPEIIELLQGVAEVIPNTSRDTCRARRARARDAQAIMVFMPDSIDDAFLQACPQLKIVGAALKGCPTSTSPPAPAAASGFPSCHADHPDRGTDHRPAARVNATCWKVTARSAAAAFRGSRLVRHGAHRAYDRHHRHGCGRPRHRTRLAGFDMQILYCDHVALPTEQSAQWNARQVELDELLAASDFIVPMLPMTPETLHLINADTLARMRPEATW